MNDALVEIGNGSIVANDYRVDEFVTRGGFASTYRGTRLHDGLVVAIKIMHSALHADAVMLERFLREAETLSCLNHPNIVSLVAEFEVHKGQRALATTWIEGEALANVLERSAALSVERVLHLATDILAALQHMHSRGFLHRDVKPENIVLTPAGGACLVDVGIAYRAFNPNAERLTPAGNRMGTLRYAAPEVLRDGSVSDARADQFALASTLYEALALQSPFPFADALQRYEAIEANELAPLRAFRLDVPVAVERALRRALLFAPENRFPSCEAMQKELQGIRVLT